MATQIHPRIAKRMPCSVSVGDQHHKGLVLNVSQGGLFVQTNAATPAGQAVELSLSPPGGGPSIPLHARVVWKRVVPQQFRTSARGGLGVQIEQADESYFQCLADWMRLDLDPRPNAARLVAPGEAPDFHVRILATGTRRSRCVEVLARDRDEARRTALEYAGSGWRVIECKSAKGAG